MSFSKHFRVTSLYGGQESKMKLLVFSLIFAVSIVSAGAYLLLRMRGGAMSIIIPTLDLEAVELRKVNLGATVIGKQNGLNIHFFTPSEARGFNAPKDVHVLFECPPDTTPHISMDTALGGPLMKGGVRFWAYAYSNEEEANKAAGKTGRELFTGQFHLSQAELAVTGELYGYLHTEGGEMVPGNRYYAMIDGTGVMGEKPFSISCLNSDGDTMNEEAEEEYGTLGDDADTDDDGLEDGWEVENGLDPTRTDSDNDYIQDGTELGLVLATNEGTDVKVFVPDASPGNETDPLRPDTDNDGIVDGKEDWNRNGRVDVRETDPNDPENYPLCGDSVIRGEYEECDDGIVLQGDGCSVDCYIESGFTCAGEPSVCHEVPPDQPVQECGNGIIVDTEECDDGNTAVDDGCAEDCRIMNGFSCEGEPSVCTVLPPVLPGQVCGDGIIIGSEECDDGNTEDHDGCSVTCLFESGFSCSGVPTACTAVCGDGLIRSGEMCDDGNTVSFDGCASDCQIESGFVCRLEPSDCSFAPLSACGNGVLEEGEECDDGRRCEDATMCNTHDDCSIGLCRALSDDGCSALCKIEDGFTCDDEPSMCGIIVPVLLSECLDEVDNDSDTFVDEDDPDCQTGDPNERESGSNTDGITITVSRDAASSQTILTMSAPREYIPDDVRRVGGRFYRLSTTGFTFYADIPFAWESPGIFTLMNAFTVGRYSVELGVWGRPEIVLPTEIFEVKDQP